MSNFSKPKSILRFFIPVVRAYVGSTEGYFLAFVLADIFPGVAISRGGEPSSCQFGSLGSTDCAAPDILLYCQLTTATIEWWYTDPSVMAVSPNEV